MSQSGHILHMLQRSLPELAWMRVCRRRPRSSAASGASERRRRDAAARLHALHLQQQQSTFQASGSSRGSGMGSFTIECTGQTLKVLTTGSNKYHVPQGTIQHLHRANICDKARVYAGKAYLLLRCSPC